MVLREGKTIIRSQRMIEELRTFVYRNGRPDHMDGFHDDIIMAYAMPLFIVQTSFKKLEKAKEQTKAMLDSWVNVSANNASTVNKQTYTNPVKSNSPTYNQPQINQGGGNDNGEYNWLFGIRQ